MDRRKALIFGTSGQDGSYLSELLIEKDYEVAGVVRRVSVDNTERLETVKSHDNFKLIEGDIIDPSSVNNIISSYQPDECYNLAAQSHVATSFEQPTVTFNINAVGPLNILEALRNHSPHTRFYQASTSEMFGNNYSERVSNFVPYQIPNNGYLPDGTRNAAKELAEEMEHFQDELTPLSPASPYAVAKVAAHHLVGNYREAYGIHGSCGILFNHESPRRGEKFVTRKITKWIGEFKSYIDKWDCETCANRYPDVIDCFNFGSSAGLINYDPFPKLRLGNLDACRDWGHARDFVYGMWLMLQQDDPDDYVLCTGQTKSVRDFLDVAFKECMDITDWSDFVVIDPKFYRPSDVEFLKGDCSKAKEKLNWESQTTFQELVKEMVEADSKSENFAKQ